MAHWRWPEMALKDPYNMSRGVIVKLVVTFSRKELPVTNFAVAAGIGLSASVVARGLTDEPCLFPSACDCQEADKATFRHAPLFAISGLIARRSAAHAAALAPVIQACHFEEEAERWDGLS